MAPPLISARRRVKDREVIGSGVWFWCVYNLLIKKKCCLWDPKLVRWLEIGKTILFIYLYFPISM